jgi:hypothetical protein
MFAVQDADDDIEERAEESRKNFVLPRFDLDFRLPLVIGDRFEFEDDGSTREVFTRKDVRDPVERDGSGLREDLLLVVRVERPFDGYSWL